MFSGDEDTLRAVRELCRIANGDKKIVIWTGAGVSANAGLPSWSGLAESIHREFKRTERTYKSVEHTAACLSNDYPNFFSYCKSINAQRYRVELIRLLGNGRSTPVFSRMCAQLKDLRSIRVVSTNVDELLESQIHFPKVIQRTDIERLIGSLHSEENFLCKLHGTVSSVESLVFTREEYEELSKDSEYIAALTALLSETSVVFLGYSLQDEYLIRLLQDRVETEKLFGNGPHFVVSNSVVPGLPSSIRQIKYNSDPQVGHRGFLTVLDLLKIAPAPQGPTKEKVGMKSKFYLPDFFEIGTWQSSQTFVFGSKDGNPQGTGYVGTGFVDGEIGTVRQLGLHNLVVGLVCYDKTVLPLESLGMFHHVVGSTVFWRLVDAQCLEFVWSGNQPSVVFAQHDLTRNGGLVAMQLQDQVLANQPESFDAAVFRQIKIVRAGTMSKDAIVEKLKSISTAISASVFQRAVNDALGALVMPNVRNSLGMSDGITPTRVPKWFVFPVLRVAHLMKDAAIAEEIGAAASQLPFGTFGLANAAFSLKSFPASAGDVASYIVAGQYEADLGAVFREDANALDAILRFRESKTGIEVREMILHTTAFDGGLELPSAVEGALRSAFPTRLLARSRQGFANLFTASDRAALWSSQANSDSDFKLWRTRSAGILQDVVKQEKIEAFSSCPCGSGDSFKFCCKQLLLELETGARASGLAT